MTTPVQLLRNSKLRKPADDIDINQFNFMMRNKLGIRLVSAITDAVINRTIDGASTFTVSIDDDNKRTVQLSGRLGRKVDTEIDGTFWTLVDVKKNQRSLQLISEERVVNVLRYYNKFKFANRSKVTRAEFVLQMLKEVKEIPIRYYIPELKVVQPISDVGPGQFLIDGSGNPVTKPTQESQVQSIPLTVRLTVKSAPATPEQINNANIILQKGTEKGANQKVLVSSIMTAITESRIINLTGGDRDSVGVFQQRASQGWPATRDIPTDAAAYFDQAIALDKSDPNLPLRLLCQGVQRSFDSSGSNYASWQNEAEQFVKAFGLGTDNGVEKTTGGGTGISSNNSAIVQNSQVGNYYMRGQITQKTQQTGNYGILTPENTWQCMGRLADEVNWRAFCVNGVIWFVSDQWLFKSKVMLRISEDSLGVDWIDYDYDEGKRIATCTATVHAARWAIPPGCIVEIFDMGLIDGRWLVYSISRSLFDTIATVTLIKPQPVLPEPTTLSSLPQGITQAPPAPAGERNGSGTVPTNRRAQLIVSYAKDQIGLPYKYGSENPGVSFDCSGLAQAAYSSVGISIPRVAQDQYNAGPKLSSADILMPGDLVFFGTDTNSVEHVGIYIGEGAMIDAPHTGAYVRVDDDFMNWSNPTYVGATRPWNI